MSDQYIDYRKAKNIRPISLPDKEQYYWDLQNIENSWSGRIDANLCNTFIMEAEQQLVNAIVLFEMGYFDCAYYSLRSAVDVSTTMVFLSDLPEEEREKYLAAWKTTDDFPIQGRIIKQLKENGYIFSDMYKKMPDFFSNAKVISAELNKYVHKQGLQHFYISRNHPMNQNKSQRSFISDFQEYLEKCIGVVAVMRLAIDPFPVLLMDKEILYRCFDSMTEPYSVDFVKKYIGASSLEAYKKTELYIGTYESFIAEEKKNKTVYNVMKHQFIDTTKLDDIIKQIYLLEKHDIFSVLLVASCEKTVKVYALNGLLMYDTDRETNRKAHSWASADFKRFRTAKETINQIYDEVFISVFIFENDWYYIEHNEKLTQEEVDSINTFIKEIIEEAYSSLESNNQ